MAQKGRLVVARSLNLQITSWQQIANHFPGVQTIADLEDSGDIEFRSYQALATSSAILSGFRSVIRAATGSGKTLMVAGICGAMLPRTSLVLIHGRELVSQTYKSLRKYLGKDVVGVIDSTAYDPKQVTVASIDAFGFYFGEVPVNSKTKIPIMDPNVFEKRKKTVLKYLRTDVDMLVFDEVHHGSALPPPTMALRAQIRSCR